MSTVARAQFAALLREAFLEVGSAGWKARDIGMPEEQMLVMLAPTMEPLVQSIMRKLGAPS